MVGTSSGTLHFLDTTAGLSVLFNAQVQSGPVETVVYRPNRCELAILGINSLSRRCDVKLWQLPAMLLLVAVSDLASICCWEVSLSLDMMALGLDSGYIRVFEFFIKDKIATEVLRQSETHDASISSIAICDPLKVFASASADGTVKIFTLHKILIRTIRLIKPSNIVFFYAESLVVNQGAYLLSISKGGWDADNSLKRTYADADNWVEAPATTNDNDINTSLLSLLRNNTESDSSQVLREGATISLPEENEKEDSASDTSTRAAVDYFSCLGADLGGAMHSGAWKQRPSIPNDPKSSRNALRPNLRATRRPFKIDLIRGEDVSTSIKKVGKLANLQK